MGSLSAPHLSVPPLRLIVGVAGHIVRHGQGVDVVGCHFVKDGVVVPFCPCLDEQVTQNGNATEGDVVIALIDGIPCTGMVLLMLIVKLAHFPPTGGSRSPNLKTVSIRLPHLTTKLDRTDVDFLGLVYLVKFTL